MHTQTLTHTTSQTFNPLKYKENTINMVKQWAIDNDYICDYLELLNWDQHTKYKEIRYK